MKRRALQVRDLPPSVAAAVRTQLAGELEEAPSIPLGTGIYASGRVVLVEAFAPCHPRPCARPRWDSTRGRTHTDARSERAAREQSALLRPLGPRGTLDGPLLVRLAYYLPVPKRPTGDRQRAGAPHTSRPDVDNLAKLTLDVLSKLGWWHDDAQVWSVTATKQYGERPGVLVRVERDEPREGP